MTTQEALEILVKHNEWRRGANTKMLEPRKIGEAIDVAITVLTGYVIHNSTVPGSVTNVCKGNN